MNVVRLWPQAQALGSGGWALFVGLGQFVGAEIRCAGFAAAPRFAIRSAAAPPQPAV